MMAIIDVNYSVTPSTPNPISGPPPFLTRPECHQRYLWMDEMEQLNKSCLVSAPLSSLWKRKQAGQNQTCNS